MRLTREDVAVIRSAAENATVSVPLLSRTVYKLCDMADDLLKMEWNTEAFVRAVEKGNEWKGRAESAESERDEWMRKYEEANGELNAQHGKYRHEVIDENIRDLRDICETLAKRIAALEGKNVEVGWHWQRRGYYWRASTKCLSEEERTYNRRKTPEGRSKPGMVIRSKTDRRTPKDGYYLRADGQGIDYINERDQTCERRRYWVADRRAGGASTGTYMRDGVTYPGRRNGHDRRRAAHG